MFSGVAGLLEEARRTSARSVNSIMTATYWEIGRLIVEYEQQGKRRAQYGAQLLERLSHDLSNRFGRGFSVIIFRSMRRFYVGGCAVILYGYYRTTHDIDLIVDTAPEIIRKMKEAYYFHVN